MGGPGRDGHAVGVMLDLLYLVLIAALFAISIAMIRSFDRL
jgi:hypothetical protein